MDSDAGDERSEYTINLLYFPLPLTSPVCFLGTYKGIAAMLDRLGRYMQTTPIEHGRDGNINSLVNAAAKYQQIRESFKGAYKDLQEEQQSNVRGGIGLGYDQ